MTSLCVLGSHSQVTTQILIITYKWPTNSSGWLLANAYINYYFLSTLCLVLALSFNRACSSCFFLDLSWLLRLCLASQHSASSKILPSYQHISYLSTNKKIHIYIVENDCSKAMLNWSKYRELKSYSSCWHDTSPRLRELPGRKQGQTVRGRGSDWLKWSFWTHRSSAHVKSQQ